MQRCAICFEPCDVDTEPEYAHFEYVTVAEHERASPDERYFCAGCVSDLREVTDHWVSGGAVETACAFCGDEDHDGSRISAEFVAQTEIGFTSSYPIYDLCQDCEEIFDTFLAGERTDHFDIPEGWDMFGWTSPHLMEIGTDHDRVRVDPAIKRTRDGEQSMSVGLPEVDANCYVVASIDNPGTASERLSEIAAFEEAGDAIEFACLVAMYAQGSPSSIDFEPDPMAEEAWIPDPIISETDPQTVAQKMLDQRSSRLEKHTT